MRSVLKLFRTQGCGGVTPSQQEKNIESDKHEANVAPASGAIRRAAVKWCSEYDPEPVQTVSVGERVAIFNPAMIVTADVYKDDERQKARAMLCRSQKRFCYKVREEFQ